MAATYYKYNPLTRVLAAEPRYIVLIDGRTIVNPTAAQYAAIGAYPLAADTPPTPPEGKVAIPDGYELRESAWHRVYRYEDAPPPSPRTFSKYRLVCALQTAGVWPQIKEWLLSQDGAYDLYIAAEDISEDEPLLAQGIAAVKELLGWDDAKVAQVLAQAEIGGAS